MLLLEAGRAVDPAADFPIPAPRERNLASRLAATARGQGVQARCAAFNARTRGLFVSDRENPYTTPAGSPFNWFRGRQVGGRLHLWARVMLRMGQEDLAGWPLGLADIAPFYDLVEDFMGVRPTPLTDAEQASGRPCKTVALCRLSALRSPSRIGCPGRSGPRRRPVA